MKIDLINSVVRICDKEKKTCGTGFFIASNLVLTASYVVLYALGLKETTKPLNNSLVNLSFPLEQRTSELRATIEYWSDEQSLCTLRCEEAFPPYIVPVSLVNESELWGHSYRTLGFPPRYRYDDGGLWSAGIIRGRLADGLMQLESDGLIDHGFTGAPVFDDHLQRVVGMIFSRSHNNKVVFMLPASEIEKAIEGIIVEHIGYDPVQVFLCHASPDKMAVRQLYVRLKEDGFSPWFDEENLIPGQRWDDEIRRAVRSSDVITVCLSKNATNKSGYIQKEIRMALDIADEKPDGHIFVIPLKLEECTIPDRLQTFQWVDLFRERGYDRLKSALSFVQNQKKS